MLGNAAYGASSDSKLNGPEGTNEPEHLLMNPLYTIPTSGKNTLSPYTTEGDVAHTYEGIQETNSPFPYKNNAGPHRPHPSVPSQDWVYQMGKESTPHSDPQDMSMQHWSSQVIPRATTIRNHGHMNSQLQTEL